MKIKGRDYPADWPAISKRIRFERAGGKCERCGVAHGALILRSTVDSGRFVYINPHGDYSVLYARSDGEEIRMSELPEEFADDGENGTRVVLTTHHIGVDKPDGTPGDPNDKMDCRDKNLAALCQRCHLEADRPLHLVARHQTHLKKIHGAQLNAGQLVLFEGEAE